MSQSCKRSSSPTAEVCYCQTHRQRLLLFCHDDRALLCHRCLQTPEHRHHRVCGTEEAAENYRKLLREVLDTLREKLEVAESILADEQERMVVIQEEEQRLREMIGAECEMWFQLLCEEGELNFQRLQGCSFDSNKREANQKELIEFCTELEEKAQETQKRLSRLGRQNLSKLKASEGRASEQIRVLRWIAAEVERQCELSPFVLLQNAKYYLERSKQVLLQSLEPAQITDLTSCQIGGMNETLTVFQRHITLDLETAHPCLVLSEDLRSVRYGNTQQDAPDTPWRFDFSATVWGAESFISGRHYWEVVVGQASKWQLGILDWTDRNNSMLQASGDKFLLSATMMGCDYTLWVFPPLRKICLSKPMCKVGIFVDCDHGRLSFYNVTEKSLIYHFSHLNFHGVIVPIFTLCIPNGDMNSDCLTVCSPHVPPGNASICSSSSSYEVKDPKRSEN